MPGVRPDITLAGTQNVPAGVRSAPIPLWGYDRRRMPAAAPDRSFRSLSREGR